MTKFEAAVADLMKQGVPEAQARSMLTAPGSPFAPGGSLAAEVVAPPAPTEPEPPAPMAMAPVTSTPMAAPTGCATHKAGNCPPGCPDVLRASSAPTHVGYAIEKHQYQVKMAEALERFAWACKAMGLDLDGKPL